MMEAEIGAMQPQAKECLSPQKLEEEEGALEGVWPCGHLDFRPVPSRTVRMSLVGLRPPPRLPPVGGNLF